MLIVVPFHNLEIGDNDDPPLGVYIESRFPVNSEPVELLTFPPPVRNSPKGVHVINDFLVTSARRLVNDYLLPKGDVQTRWVKVTPIKINVFAWRVRLDKLPSRLNLSLRGVEISSIMCPLCNSSVETASHLFFTCHVACLIWKKVLRWWDLDENMIDSYDDGLFLLKNIRLPKRLKDLYEGVC
nr:RNA-directed DNA polymerase, eukaryota [Tanacetum cinerariifolium]